MSKVKECGACGQGFGEDNNPVGTAIPSTRCINGQHEGPITRIAGFYLFDLFIGTTLLFLALSV